MSTVNPATLDYLASLEWITAKENLCLVGPAGTGKSHLLVALGVAAGHRVRYFTAVELVENLYRGLADNSVGRVIDTLLRNDLIICDEVGFAPLDDTGAQLLFRFIAAAYERRALGIASHSTPCPTPRHERSGMNEAGTRCVPLPLHTPQLDPLRPRPRRPRSATVGAMTKKTTTHSDVVVVGAGVIGLTAAIRLAEADHAVTVVTDHPPQETTSVAAGAMLGISGTGPDDPLTRATARSTPVFATLADDPTTGIHYVHGRVVTDFAAENPPWARALPDFRALTPDEARGFHSGMAVTLPFADMPTYLANLEERLRDLGAHLEHRRVEELAELTDVIVVNATGSRARELVGDATLTPMRGVHVVLSDVGITEFRMEAVAAPCWTNIFPHPGRVVVGGVALPDDDDTPDAQVAEAILARATTVEPRLAAARVLGLQVGWRPVRPQPRVEIDDAGVVHAYGHGGLGVTVSWGVAEDVVTLVEALGPS